MHCCFNIVMRHTTTSVHSNDADSESESIEWAVLAVQQYPAAAGLHVLF